MNTIDSGDQVIGRKRRAIEPEGVEDTEGHTFRRRDESEADRRRGLTMNAPDEVEDTEGHTFRTYPGAAPDDELDCRMPLPGEEDERMRRL